ncbi:acyl-CoA dehydrogenase family protein [Cryptosporangium sp. NPDC051539]|uniref:acyl-CoA dehydrogenase family protein n=1 Tax=Cryptosporangium sp. NPDC051539 TaxID=3363962 RepID=UPI0037BD261A
MTASSIDHTAEDVSPPATLTPDEALAIAEQLRPQLLADQADTELRTTYSPAMHEQFRQAGFYRLLQPVRYGGYAFDMPSFLAVMESVARGCMSTGWCLCLGASHALLVASLWPKEVQDVVFADGHVVIPSTARPGGAARRTENGDWVLNTTHPYSSGSPYSTHYIGQAFELDQQSGAPAQQMLFIAPRDSYEVLDDWGRTLGLKGSGSNTIVLRDAHLPREFVLENTMQVDLHCTNTSPGFELHGDPMHLAPGQGFFGLDLATLFIGGAFGALDEYELLMRERKTAGDAGRAPAARLFNADYQRWYGLATARLNSSRAIVRSAAEQWTAICDRAARGGQPFTTEEDAMINMMSREATRLAWSAAQDILFRTAGSSAAVNGERMERSFRNLAQAWSHVNMVIEDSMARDWSKAHLALGTEAD